MMPAARVGDLTAHGSPLAPGLGSPTVFVGFMPAWRALPASMAGAVDSISNSMRSFMIKPVMTPADAAADLAMISANLIQGGAQAAAAGAPAAAGTASSMVATLNSSNVALTATWTSASAVPGGMAPATAAYTEGIKVAAAAAASAVMFSMASLADMNMCPLPLPSQPHGPGFVTKGSGTVVINNLSAVRISDSAMEACGGADPVALGDMTVMIGG